MKFFTDCLKKIVLQNLQFGVTAENDVITYISIEFELRRLDMQSNYGHGIYSVTVSILFMPPAQNTLRNSIIIDLSCLSQG